MYLYNGQQVAWKLTAQPRSRFLVFTRLICVECRHHATLHTAARDTAAAETPAIARQPQVARFFAGAQPINPAPALNPALVSLTMAFALSTNDELVLMPKC